MTPNTKLSLPMRQLGRSGVKLPAIGYGAMSLSSIYGSANDEASKALLQEAINLGCIFWDTADAYGYGHNEELIGSVLRESRDKVFLATKFGFAMGDDKATGRIYGSRDYVLQACDASLQRLGVDYIDLYYSHRVDPLTPIEETVAAMKELQDAGKIKFIGLSECSKETLLRALKVARIDAVQIEYSPWETGPETSGLLDVMRENGVSLVAYSPLGRGMLTGQIKSRADLAENDLRHVDPRLQGEAFELNLRMAGRISELAAAKAQAMGEPVTPAAFCLAWILYQGDEFFVIPGTRSVNRLKENLSAGKVLLSFTKEDDEEVKAIVKEIGVVGERYPEAMMAAVGL